MANLCGFGHDCPGGAGVPPNPPPNPAFTAWTSGIKSALYRIAASIGCKAACPVLPNIAGGLVAASCYSSAGFSFEFGGFVLALECATAAAIAKSIAYDVVSEIGCANCPQQ